MAQPASKLQHAAVKALATDFGEVIALSRFSNMQSSLASLKKKIALKISAFAWLRQVVGWAQPQRGELMTAASVAFQGPRRVRQLIFSDFLAKTGAQTICCWRIRACRIGHQWLP